MYLVVITMVSNEGLNLFPKICRRRTHFTETSFRVHHFVELLGSGHAAFRPKGSTHSIDSLDRASMGGVLFFQLQIQFFQLTSSLDQVLLSAEFLQQMIQLIQWTFAKKWIALTTLFGFSVFVLQIERFQFIAALASWTIASSIAQVSLPMRSVFAPVTPLGTTPFAIVAGRSLLARFLSGSMT